MARGFIPAGLRSSPKKGLLRSPTGINPLATKDVQVNDMTGFTVQYSWLISLRGAYRARSGSLRDLTNDPEDHRRYLHRPQRPLRSGSGPFQQFRGREPG
ncbi:hypothetical protein C0J56_26610 [Pseudomonas fluorescens]|nr:hypothetical protein C0J56_26610 [Pseudomonas fluorescens]